MLNIFINLVSGLREDNQPCYHLFLVDAEDGDEVPNRKAKTRWILHLNHWSLLSEC
jgi:hypothetical protein